MSADSVLLTYRYRVKDATVGKHLERMAFAVNQVWNYCCQIQNDSRRLNKRWAGVAELCKLVAGTTKELGIHSDTLQDIVKHWVRGRDAAGKRSRWRSRGKNRSLGWVPFMSRRAIQVVGDTVTMLGQPFRLWMPRDIPDDVRSGNFSQDATGKWFLNLVCAVPADRPTGNGEIGIDLGLKTLAALSKGEKVRNPRHIRKGAGRLARAQRAGRKNLARKIHRKVAAQRRHYLHNVSAGIAKAFSLVVVGNVNSVALARTKMAKSVLDAGWSMLRSMLHYKLAMTPGARFVCTDESGSTQTCCACGARTGPKGLKGLGVRDWECSSCGAWHDRDTNSAVNILISGRNIALP